MKNTAKNILLVIFIYMLGTACGVMTTPPVQAEKTQINVEKLRYSCPR